MNWLGLTYLFLGLFSLASAVVNLGQGIAIRTDRSLFSIALGCSAFGLFNVGVAFTSSYGGSPYVHDVFGYVIAALGTVLLTAAVPMIPWTIFDAPMKGGRLWFLLGLVAFSLVRGADTVWRATTQPNITWEALHFPSFTPLAIPGTVLPILGAGVWVVEGLRAMRQRRRLGLSFTVFGAMAVMGAAKGLLMALGVLDPPDLFGFMALPAIAFVNVASSVRFIDAVRTANKPVGDFERYQILRKLGSGGYGDVFLARRRGPAGFLREVVLKTLRSATGDVDARERFLSEARLAAQLRHPNIVDVYDLGEAPPDGFFIVMERIDGLTLGELIRRDAVVPADVVAEIGAQLCRALGYAHAARVIHRDIKPQNAMVTVAGVAKLIDFGIAQEAGAAARERGAPVSARGGSGSITRDDGVVGTVGYMPPERLRGQPATVATDIFAMGVVLYELATKQAAFPPDVTQMMAAVEQGAFERVASLRPDFPKTLAAAIEQCLSASPGSRPSSAAALEAEFSTVLGERRVDLAAWLMAMGQEISSANTQPAQRTTPMGREDRPTAPARSR